MRLGRRLALPRSRGCPAPRLVSGVAMRLARRGGGRRLSRQRATTLRNAGEYMADESGDNSLCLLLVDDHAESLRPLAVLLAREGYRVRSAGTVAEARVIAREGPCDLLVADIGLPDGSGLDLMRELAADRGLRGVALSVYTEE